MTKDAFVLVVTNQDGKITNVNVFHDEDKAIEEMNNQMIDCVNDALARGNKHIVSNKYIVSKKTYWGVVKTDNGSEYHWDIVQDFNYNTRL